jgi:hypothetical protein
MVEAALSRGLSASEAAAAAIGGGSVEQAAAAAEAAWRAEAAHPQAPPLVAAAAAHVASLVAASGGSPGVAASAAANAANAILRGETIASVHSMAIATARASQPFDESRAAQEGCVAMPGWSLEQWVDSLKLGDYVTASLLGRLKEMAAPRPTAPLELPFLRRLADDPEGVQIILALLKERPVLPQIAERIHAEAKKMVAAGRRASAADDDGQEGDAADAANASDASDPSASASASGGGKGDTKRLRALGRMAMGMRGKMSSRLNAEWVSAGARTLFFSKDASMYWKGLTTLVGNPRPIPSESLGEAMEREHCGAADADVPFDASNYRTTSTSRIEWYFVARPSELSALAPHLERLGQPTGQWPMIGSSSETTDDDELRKAQSFAQFEKRRRDIDAQLTANGEQPLSFVEFAALRCYSG